MYDNDLYSFLSDCFMQLLRSESTWCNWIEISLLQIENEVQIPVREFDNLQCGERTRVSVGYQLG